MHSNLKLFALGFIAVAMITLQSCTEEGDSTKDPDTTTEETKPNQTPERKIKVEFNEDSAYHYVQSQVDFGPRVPGTAAHAATANYLAQKLRSYCDTLYVQDARILDFRQRPMNITNLIGSFNPEMDQRVMLCAHWDTRPQADQDPERPDEPADGANDGASGVGVLLEVARQLAINSPNIGIDILFFDAEDGGEMGGPELTWCLGSQYWAKNTHVKDYAARYGILLDMVGGEKATFLMEGHSVMNAPQIVQKVWSTGQRLGYGKYFMNLEGGMITDDHLFIMSILSIPTIDIIQYSFADGNGFGDFWHTHGDNMSVINKETLDAVGTTVLQVVYNER